MPQLRPALAASLALVFSLVALTPAHAADPASWSVGPAAAADGATRPNFDLALDPGTTVTDGFSVRNDGATELTLAVYAADAYTTREGNIDLLPAGETSVDAGTWVSLETGQVTLRAGEQRVIPFTITVPADARPGDHTAGIVASLTSADPNAQVQVDRRLGSRMYLRVSGDLVPSVEVGGLSIDYSGSWNPLAIGTLTVDYSLLNSGNTRVTALSSLDTAGPLGAASVGTGDTQLPEVLPGSEIDVHHELSGIGALLWLSGSVDVVPASVGLGAARLDAVALPFTIPTVPWALLLIVLAIGLVVVAVVVLVRRRGRRRVASE